MPHQNQRFFQIEGVNAASMGIISSLPSIMHVVKTILLRFEKSAKLPMGPTSSKPGPMLLMVAITAEKEDIKSKLSIETIITEKMIMTT